MKTHRTRVSYIVKHDYSDHRHTAGINALALDPNYYSDVGNVDQPGSGAGGAGVLYTGGRDTIINAWDLHVDFQRLREETELRDMVSLGDQGFERGLGRILLTWLQQSSSSSSTRRSSVANRNSRVFSQTQQMRKTSLPPDMNMPYRAPSSFFSLHVDSPSIDEPVSPGGAADPLAAR
ncbi:hypothetical protein HK101_005116, partial [Irineochytrium annulatum]